MASIDNGIKIYFRHNVEDAEPYKVVSKSLVEFAVWFERMKLQAVEIIPNGMTGVIIITEKRYIVAGF